MKKRSLPDSHPSLEVQLVNRAKRAVREEAATRASDVSTLTNSVSDLDGRVGTLENV